MNITSSIASRVANEDAEQRRLSFYGILKIIRNTKNDLNKKNLLFDNFSIN